MKKILVVGAGLVILGAMAYSAVGLVVRNISGVFKGIPDKVETFRIYEGKAQAFHDNFEKLSDAERRDAEKQMLYYQSKIAHYAADFLEVLDKNNQLSDGSGT